MDKIPLTVTVVVGPEAPADTTAANLADEHVTLLLEETESGDELEDETVELEGRDELLVKVALLFE